MISNTPTSADRADEPDAILFTSLKAKPLTKYQRFQCSVIFKGTAQITVISNHTTVTVLLQEPERVFLFLVSRHLRAVRSKFHERTKVSTWKQGQLEENTFMTTFPQRLHFCLQADFPQVMQQSKKLSLLKKLINFSGWKAFSYHNAALLKTLQITQWCSS